MSEHEPPGEAAGHDQRSSTAVTTSGAGRRFGDAEIQRILRTAVELQERAQTFALDQGRGLTLDELRQIAQEAGIDPRFVDLAVTEGDGPLERTGGALAGGAYRWRFHSEVPGEITDEDRNRILREIRAATGKKGEFEDVYGRMEWSVDDGVGPTIIGIESRNGKTEIDVSADKLGEVAMIYGLGVPMGGLMGGALIGAGLGFDTPGKVALMGVMAGVSLVAGRFGWHLRSRWWERHLRRLLQRLATNAQDAAQPTPASREGE